MTRNLKILKPNNNNNINKPDNDVNKPDNNINIK